MSFDFTDQRTMRVGTSWSAAEERDSPTECTISDLLEELHHYDETVRCKATDKITEIIKKAHESAGDSELTDLIVSDFSPALFLVAKLWTGIGQDAHFCSEMSAVAAICLVAANLDRYDKRWVFYTFLPSFSALLVHESSMARKFAFTHLVDFANQFGDQFTEVCLLPHFLNGCSDDNFRVRKVCAEQFGSIAARCSNEARESGLTTAFLSLLNDRNRAVHLAAANQLGPFIVSFADSERTGLTIRDGKLVRTNQKTEDRSSVYSDDSECETPPPDPEMRDSFFSFSPSALPVPTLTLECECDEVGEQPQTSTQSSDDCQCARLSSTSTHSSMSSSESAERPTVVADYSQPPPGFQMPDAARRLATPDRPVRADFSTSDDEDRSGCRTPRRAPCRMFAPPENFDETDDEEDEDGHLNQSFRGDDEEDEEEENEHLPSQSAEQNSLFGTCDEQSGAKIPKLEFRCSTPEDESREVAEIVAELLTQVGELVDERWDEPDEEKPTHESTVVQSLALIPASSSLITIGLARTPPSRFSTPPHWTASFRLPPGVSPLSRRISPTTLAIGAANGDPKMIAAARAQAETEDAKTESPIFRLPSGVSPLTRRLSPTATAIAAADGEEALNAVVDAQLTAQSSSFESPKSSHGSSGGVTGSLSAAFRSGVNRFLPSNVQKNATAMMHQLASPFAKLTSPTPKKAETIPRTPEPLKSPLRPRRLFGSPKRPYTEISLESPQEIKRFRSEVGGSPPPTALRARCSTTQRDSEVVRPIRVFDLDSWIGLDGLKRFLSTEERDAYNAAVQDAIPQQLLDSLETFQSHDLHDPSDTHNTILARDFPAIAFTFGPDRWLFVKSIFLSLVYSPQVSIRSTMAQSLHEIAQILGVETADRDLVPVFRRFVASDTADVQFGLLSHLSDFFAAISESQRLELAAQLSQFRVAGAPWRVKHEFIEQLTLMVELFKPYPVNEHFAPFALSFATDQTAEVRRSSVNMITTILGKFIDHEHAACRASGRSIADPDSTPLTTALLGELGQGFAESKAWRKRQTFAMILESLLRRELVEPPVYCRLFKERVRDLLDDKVTNVRHYFPIISQLLRRSSVSDFDPEWHEFVRNRLHELAADDPELEIKLQARVALGTVDGRVDEVDFNLRSGAPESEA